MKLAVKVERGSGNVFQDLSLPDAQERLAKAELAHAICGVIEAAGWTQSQAAARLGIDQPKISSLMRGRLRDFSTERLMRYLTMLDRDVVILIQNPGRNRPAAVRVLSRAS
jgi:predicted XRE-type DNA-binding protein